MNQTGRTDFSLYQTDVLFLLVGRNPLPNYVAANLLLKPQGILYLVHSEGPQGTGLVAQNLATRLSQYQPQLIPVNLQNTAALRQQVERYLARTPSGPIGLNYTGGTKVMAVHTYQAVEEFCRRRGREPIFSYLDADTLEMTIEPRSGHSAFRRKVVEAVELSFEEAFKLHGIRLKGKPQTEPMLPDLARVLAKMHSTPNGVEAWQTCRKKVLPNCNRRPWLDVEPDLRGAGAAPGVMSALEQALNLSPPKPIDLQTAARQAGFNTEGGLLEWMAGKWLEDWVLTCVRDLSYETRARGLKGFKSREFDFELDVVIMRGYQLFAISCSVTSKRGEAKLKFLEIYTRAQQIGGEEARAAMVALVKDPEGLEQEIASDWDAANRVRVFGPQHLSDLEKHLKAWFKGEA